MKRYPLVLAFALALAACDEESQADVLSCGDLAIAACGGDVVGSWASVLVCTDEADLGEELPPECADTRVTLPVSAYSVDFAGDGTYAADYSAVGTLGIGYSAACLVTISEGQLTAEATCEQLHLAFQTYDPPWACSFAEDFCTCSTELNEQGEETGTYVAAGTTLTMTPAGDTPTAVEYCVAGDDLTFLEDTGAVRFVRQ